LLYVKELTKIYRQANGKFIDFLNGVRNKKYIMNDILSKINNRLKWRAKPKNCIKFFKGN